MPTYQILRSAPDPFGGLVYGDKDAASVQYTRQLGNCRSPFDKSGYSVIYPPTSHMIGLNLAAEIMAVFSDDQMR